MVQFFGPPCKYNYVTALLIAGQFQLPHASVADTATISTVERFGRLGLVQAFAHCRLDYCIIYLFVYYETRTKVHKKEKRKNTQGKHEPQKKYKKKYKKKQKKNKHITKNTSHGAYIVHN